MTTAISVESQGVDAPSPVTDRRRALTESVMAVLLLWLVVRVAWMSDDGLINVRAALNLAHGNGAGFNAGERVQAFTSPLWFGLEYAAARTTGEYIVSAIVIGAVCAVAAVVLLAHRARTMLQATTVVIVFALSSSLIDYATGGLENGLAMLLVTVFLLLAHGQYGDHPTSARRLALLALAAAAVVLTRYDYVLVVAPVLAVVALQQLRRDRRTMMPLAIAFVGPLAMWAAVSYGYFGSIVPNTLAAKTNVDIARWELLGTGARYLTSTVVIDPVLALAVLAGLTLAAIAGTRLHRATALGIVFYLAYVVWIGGDFMAGRFLTTPAIASMWLLSTIECPAVGRWRGRQVGLALAASFAVLGAWPMIIARPSADSAPRWDIADNSGIADEAAVWRHHFGWTLGDALFGDADRTTDGDAPSAKPGLAPLRAIESLWSHYEPPPTGVERPIDIACGGLGVRGMSAGPALYIIDQCALTDAFLAQQPWQIPDDGRWRIGHFARDLPDGYIDAVRFADPSRLTDATLRAQLEATWKRVR